MDYDIRIQGIPENVPKEVAGVCRSRLINAVTKFLDESGIKKIKLNLGTASEFETKTINNNSYKKNDRHLTPEERANKYIAAKPLFDFEQLIVPNQVQEELSLVVDLIRFESKVFDEWGLRKIEPFPRTALNFHGLPGTGKTLAAHAISSKIDRSILVASYAQIESMYHGEGPKNVEAIFLAAERDNAVLFIDEADSLLSKRLTNVTQGSEQAINSMRSQLFICLERFRGIVIFSTNLVTNYDKAFETRVRHVHFPMPDRICRQKIWQIHLPEQLPLEEGLSCEELAKIDDICGRDIKNAVIDSAMKVVRQGRNRLKSDDFIESVNHIKAARITASSADKSLKIGEKLNFQERVKEALPEKSSSCRIE